jgi:DNA-binding transcriptional LysR family regulator
MLPTLLVVGNAEAMKRLVVAGLGSALTSSVAVRDEVRAGLLKSYPASVSVHDLGVEQCGIVTFSRMAKRRSRRATGCAP